MSQTSLSAQPAAQQAKTSSPQSCTEIRPLVGWASKPSLEGSRRISLAQHLISERVQQDLRRVSTSHLYAIHEWCENHAPDLAKHIYDALPTEAQHNDDKLQRKTESCARFLAQTDTSWEFGLDHAWERGGFSRTANKLSVELACSCCLQVVSEYCAALTVVMSGALSPRFFATTLAFWHQIEP